MSFFVAIVTLQFCALVRLQPVRSCRELPVAAALVWSVAMKPSLAPAGWVHSLYKELGLGSSWVERLSELPLSFCHPEPRQPSEIVEGVGQPSL
jgi:hypothetical protein